MASASCRSCRFKIDCLEQDTISAPPVSTRLLPNCPIEAKSIKSGDEITGEITVFRSSCVAAKPHDTAYMI